MLVITVLDAKMVSGEGWGVGGTEILDKVLSAI